MLVPFLSVLILFFWTRGLIFALVLALILALVLWLSGCIFFSVEGVEGGF